MLSDVNAKALETLILKHYILKVKSLKARHCIFLVLTRVDYHMGSIFLYLQVDIFQILHVAKIQYFRRTIHSQFDLLEHLKLAQNVIQLLSVVVKRETQLFESPCFLRI
jgi:hypothetical protein